MGRERVDRELGPIAEAIRRVRTEPEFLAQPRRVGEVVERHQRLEAAIDAPAGDRGVAVECATVDRSVFGNHPGPLDPHPEAVAPEYRGAVERLLGPLPEADRAAGGLDLPDLLPGEPVVGGLAGSVESTLDLEAGRRDPEEEVVGHHSVAPVHFAPFRFAPVRPDARSIWGHLGDPSFPSSTCRPFVDMPVAWPHPGRLVDLVRGPGGRRNGGW